jgi:uncharacterized membrane protein YcaP (DUF421 family)
MFFDDWDSIIRVLVLGVSAYIALVSLLRVSGKRTLAKLNAFDLVVTVALGSALATVILSKDVSLAQGLAAFIILGVAQYIIAALSVRFPAVEMLAKANARCLLVDGKMLDPALRQERVTRQEILAAIRTAGYGETDAIAAVVLETDGSFSVIPKSQAGNRDAFPPSRAAER